MTTIILIRHGETKGNRDGLFRGRIDFPLNDNGIRQARDLAQALEHSGLAAVYASPLTRATATAEIVARPHGLPVAVEAGFTDIDLGLWQGRPREEIKEKFPELWHVWITEPERLRVPDGETLPQVQDRAFAALARIVRENPGRTVAVVSHRAVLKPLLARALGVAAPYFWKFHFDNGSYSTVEWTPERGFILTRLNETCHLKDYVKETV
jgi:probable phosphoglycerate mutase